jgi:hypothetical protein
MRAGTGSEDSIGPQFPFWVFDLVADSLAWKPPSLVWMTLSDNPFASLNDPLAYLDDAKPLDGHHQVCII